MTDKERVYRSLQNELDRTTQELVEAMEHQRYLIRKSDELSRQLCSIAGLR